jgi:hypothetical protein
MHDHLAHGGGLPWRIIGLLIHCNTISLTGGVKRRVR